MAEPKGVDELPDPNGMSDTGPGGNPVITQEILEVLDQLDTSDPLTMLKTLANLGYIDHPDPAGGAIGDKLNPRGGYFNPTYLAGVLYKLRPLIAHEAEALSALDNTVVALDPPQATEPVAGYGTTPEMKVGEDDQKAWGKKYPAIAATLLAGGAAGGAAVVAVDRYMRSGQPAAGEPPPPPELPKPPPPPPNSTPAPPPIDKSIAAYMRA